MATWCVYVQYSMELPLSRVANVCPHIIIKTLPWNIYLWTSARCKISHGLGLGSHASNIYAWVHGAPHLSADACLSAKFAAWSLTTGSKLRAHYVKSHVPVDSTSQDSFCVFRDSLPTDGAASSFTAIILTWLPMGCRCFVSSLYHRNSTTSISDARLL